MRLNSQRRIYKIDSDFIRKNKWSINLPLDVAMSDYPDYIVTLNDSQLTRWIDEINGIPDYSEEIKNIKNRIRINRAGTDDTNNKRRRKTLYRQLYRLQFMPDLVFVVMTATKDYYRANEGFTINGKRYRRLLGSTGGIKNKTIIYINADIYPTIMDKINNGRNMSKELVPAKLNAYMALCASGSVPVPQPQGVIVVNDCITNFTEDVITIADDPDGGDPIMQEVNDYPIERNASDGCGMMSPAYSRRLNQYLNGIDDTLSACNTRWAFEKGVIFTFDFVDFAKKIAGTYLIKDAWGDIRDIRNADVILTVSMLKLWDSYQSFDDYYNNCITNGYQFAVAKTAPAELENIRSTNYQFLQSFNFTDLEIENLCQPMIDEINDIKGGDYRKSIIYLGGENLTANKVVHMPDDYLKALMIDPEMINDPYIQSQIAHNIAKKIDMAKLGKIDIAGNYAIIGGDLFALAQSMFGLPITGLLASREIYHKYWIDKGDAEVACFRAPMTNANNIRRMALDTSDDCAYWFRYCKTVMLINAFDTLMDALNGCDFDGDTSYCTDNPIIINNIVNAPAIICQQRKAEKKIPTEEDMIASNILAFDDGIGAITNRATAMYDVQSQFSPESEEYKMLQYRILCCQHLQQSEIDKSKGIISNPMPPAWYKVDSDDTDFFKSIVADKKPYFMIYRYPELKANYTRYINDCNTNAMYRYRMDVAELQTIANPSDEVKTFLKFYDIGLPVTLGDCTVILRCL